MTAPLKLITETYFNGLLSEKSSEGDLYIEGIFMQAEKKNHNGRIYPIEIMKPEVDAYCEEFVKTKRAIGELNHPTDVSVNPERASHLITSIRQEGNDFIGKAKILNTPQGNIVRGLIEGGVKLGVSSRGLGSVKEGKGKFRGVDVVQNDFKLITVDVVSNPSAPDAFVEGIYESMSYMINNGVISPYVPKTTIKVSSVLKECVKKGKPKAQQLKELLHLMRYI